MPAPAPRRRSRPLAGRGPDDALRALHIKGYAARRPSRPRWAARADGGARRSSTRLVADGLAEPGAGAFRLTADGRTAATALIAADAAAWGTAAATPRSTPSSRSTTG